MTKIAIVGSGYVGLSNAVLLSQNHGVVALDINEDKVQKINNRISPIGDTKIEDYLKKRDLRLTATTDKQTAYEGAEYVIIANRLSDDINDVSDKVYTRELFGGDT